MRTNAQEAVLSAYIASIGKRTPREAAQDAAELCRLANSLSHLNEIACNCGHGSCAIDARTSSAMGRA